MDDYWIPTVNDIFGLKLEIEQVNDGDQRQCLIKKYRYYLHQFGASIHHDSSFEGQPFFPHGLYGVFVSRGAKMGKNCIIFHQVTIGSNMTMGSSTMGFPCLGDNVYLGAGAKVIGSVKIGSNVIVGANTVVVEDVPDNSVVIGQKPRILQRKSVDTRYFSKDAKLGWAYYSDGSWIRNLSKQEVEQLTGCE